MHISIRIVLALILARIGSILTVQCAYWEQLTKKSWFQLHTQWSWMPFMGYRSAKQIQKPVKIHRKLLLSELGLALVLSIWMYGSNGSVHVHGILLYMCLWVVSCIDFKYHIIPDLLSLGGTAIGCLLPIIQCIIAGNMDTNAWSLGLYLATEACLGAIIGSSVLLWMSLVFEYILKKEALGFGDVKLMGVIGSFCGYKGALFSIFMGSIIGCGVILSAALFNRRRWFVGVDYQAGVQMKLKDQPFPFGPWLSLAAGIYYFIQYGSVTSFRYLYPYIPSGFQIFFDKNLLIL